MLLRNFIGEPYAGKLHVRFDEGAGKGFSPSRSTLLTRGYVAKEKLAEMSGNNFIFVYIYLIVKILSPT